MFKYLSKFLKKNKIIEVQVPFVEILNDDITEEDIKVLPIAQKYYHNDYYWNKNLDDILLNIVNMNLHIIHWGKIASYLNKMNILY